MFSVTTATEETDLTTLAAVKSELNISGAGDDTYLKRQIQVATSKIVSYLEVKAANDGSVTIGREALEETFRPGCIEPRVLILSRWPVVSIETVTVDGTEFTTDDYEFDGASGLLYRLCGSNRIAWCADEIIVEYTAGWLLPDEDGRTLPQDIEDACINLVKAARFARNRDPLLKSETTEGIGSNDYWVGGTPGGASIPADIAAVLDRYKV